MDPMQSRIFEEIDQQGKRMEDISKITYENSATLSILSKIVILILGFLVVAGVTASYNTITKKVLDDHKKYEQYQNEKTRSVGPIINKKENLYDAY